MLNSNWHKLSICSLLIVGSLALLPLNGEAVPPPPERDPIAAHYGHHGRNWNNYHGNHWRGDWGGRNYHRPYNYYYNDPYYYYYNDGYTPYYYDSGINIRFR